MLPTARCRDQPLSLLASNALALLHGLPTRARRRKRIDRSSSTFVVHLEKSFKTRDPPVRWPRSPQCINDVRLLRRLLSLL